MWLLRNHRCCWRSYYIRYYLMTVMWSWFCCIDECHAQIVVIGRCWADCMCLYYSLNYTHIKLRAHLMPHSSMQSTMQYIIIFNKSKCECAHTSITKIWFYELSVLCMWFSRSMYACHCQQIYSDMFAQQLHLNRIKLRRKERDAKVQKMRLKWTLSNKARQKTVCWPCSLVFGTSDAPTDAKLW